MTDNRTLPPVFTPKTLAKFWLCSESHIRNLMKSGQLKSFKLGGKLARIQTDDVLEFERANMLRGRNAGD